VKLSIFGGDIPYSCLFDHAGLCFARQNLRTKASLQGLQGMVVAILGEVGE